MHQSCVRSFRESIVWQTYSLKLCEKFLWKLCSILSFSKEAEKVMRKILYMSC